MNIRPFAAVRPSREAAPRVASVPYDVVDTQEARVLAQGNPMSFLHVSRPEIDMPEGTNPSSLEAYGHARKALDQLRASHVLVRALEPRFYAYRQVMGAHMQTGLVATFDTKDYLAGILKQHEKTRADKEDDRTRHIEILNAQTGPAFLTYRDVPSLDALIAEVTLSPCCDDFVASDGVRHQVWEIPVEKNGTICSLFEQIPVAYIADGHHRSAAASRFARAHNFEGEARWFMAVAFPASQLQILPYNRLVADLNGLSSDAFLACVRQTFTVTKVADGCVLCARHVRMFLENQWYDLAWKVSPKADVVSSLDVSVLQSKLLAPILGIEDPRTSPRISFMGGVRTLEELSGKVSSHEAAVAFSMFPVTVEEMMSIADAGAIMPPKSTWFEPKLRSGLFIHDMD